MSTKPRKSLLIVSVLLVTLMLTGLSCNLFSSQEIEEPEPEVEEEPAWSPELVFRLEHEEGVNSVAYTHDGALIATATLHGVNIWNAADGSLVRSLEDQSLITGDAIAFTQDDQAFATTTSNLGVWFLSAMDGEEILRLEGGFDNVLDFSPDGNLIATGNRAGVIWLHQTDDGELLAEMDPGAHVDDYSEWVSAVAFSPDGASIASMHYDGAIFIWAADSGELIRTIIPQETFGLGKQLSFSVDGQYLAAAGGAGESSDAEVLRIWDVTDGSLYQSFTIGRNNEAVKFSPDGSLLAAGDRDGIMLWSYPGFELVHVIPNEVDDTTFYVTDLAFSPDSQFLTAGYSDSYALVWQVQE